MKKKLLLIIPSIVTLFSCVTNNAKNTTSSVDSINLKDNNLQKVSIKFNANGGKLIGQSLLRVNKNATFGSIKSKVPSVKRRGSSDNPGWYFKVDGVKTIVSDATVIDKDYTFYANWNLYDVTFNSGLGKWADTNAGATKKLENVSYIYNDDMARPTYSGGKFLGWYDGDTLINFPYTPSENKTLTAKYDVKEVSLFFVAEDGYFGSTSEKSKQVKVPYGTKWEDVQKLSSFPKANIDSDDLGFDCWKISGADIQSNYEFNSATVIKATYSDAISVSFDVASNGGTWSTTSSETRKAKIIKKDSHLFKDFKKAAGDLTTTKGSIQSLGWFSDKIATNDAIIDNYEVNSNTTYYACYDESFNITFTGQHFTVKETTSSYKRGDQIKYTINPENGYDLGSNITVSWGGETRSVTKGEYSFSNDDGVGTLIIPSAPGCDVEVSLAPTLCTITVTLHLNGGQNSSGSTEDIVVEDVVQGSSIATLVEQHGITKTGYTISSWSTRIDLSDSVTTVVSEDLYAIWEIPVTPTSEFTFSLNSTSDGYVVKKYTGTRTVINIPETYNDKPVTEIADYVSSTATVFYNKTTITEVHLPSTITKLGKLCFSGCTKLEKINTENVKDMSGARIFCNCTKLESLDFKSLENIYYGNKTDARTWWNNSPLSNCIGLKNIYNFGNCSKFNIKLFVSGAYSSNAKFFVPTLISASFSENADIETIMSDMGSLFSSSELDYVSVNKDNQNYTSRNDKGVESDVIVKTSTNEVMVGSNRGKIPSGCTGVGAHAFEGKKIETLNIPDTLRTIGESAFAGCLLLTSIDSSNNSSDTLSIASSAFSGCISLASLKLPYRLNSIDENSFNNCPVLSTIVVYAKPDGSDGKYTSRALVGGVITEMNCILDGANGVLIKIGVNETTVPPGVTKLAPYSFANNKKIESVDLTNIESIGAHCFDGCTNLTSVGSPLSKVSELGEYAFNNCTSLTSLNFTGSSFTKVPNYAFYSCTSLSSFTLPTSCTEIGTYSFYKNTALKSFSIPSNVTTIGSYAFYSSGLTSVSIPYSVSTLGSRAFSSCSNLTSVSINCKATSINYAFYGCKNLTSVSFGSSCGVKDASDAFNSCSKLTSIKFPSTIETLGMWSFDGCSALTTIDVSAANRVVSVSSDFAMGGITTLTKIYVKSSLLSSYKSTSPWSSYADIIVGK